MRFLFRNFPITQIHPHAQHAAEAAESAAAQNKFWEMHDYLYEHQQALDDNHLEKSVSKLGLDLARFNHDMSSHAYAQCIHEDFLSGVRSGVNGTPTFYINGICYNGSWDLQTLLKNPQIFQLRKIRTSISLLLYDPMNTTLEHIGKFLLT